MYRIIAPNALMSVASFEQPYFFQKKNFASVYNRMVMI